MFRVCGVWEQKTITKRIKDPNAPKRPLSAFLEYVSQGLVAWTCCGAIAAAEAALSLDGSVTLTHCTWVDTQAAIRRPDVLKENPGIAFGAVGKLMGEEWRAMPDHQKAPYVAKAEAAKAQYDIDKANYGEPQRPAWGVDANIYAARAALPCPARIELSNAAWLCSP